MADPRLSVLGDDTAAATRLALAALDLVLDRAPTVLDVGSGTGVLAVHAHARGARRVVGVEREAVLVAAARRACPDVEMVHALAEAYLATLPARAFDVVVANLPDPPLRDLVPALARAADRAVIVVGARLWQGPALRRLLARAGWPAANALAADGWCGFVARR